MNPIGIFGGTFDPIHYGHLRTAFELLQALRLTEVRFMPAGNPPHREAPIASADVRLQMVNAATEGQPGFIVDDRPDTKATRCMSNCPPISSAARCPSDAERRLPAATCQAARARSAIELKRSAICRGPTRPEGLSQR